MREGLSPLLREKLRSLPKEPGCYLMKDAKGRVIYTGKAKSLRNRVSHYFVPPNQLDFKTRALASEIYDFEVIITKTEVEALLLERTLIKHHKPHFNVLLRDDKEYPYLRVNFAEPWPRLEKVRRRKDDGAVYLGPFGSAGQLRILLGAVYRIFPLIRCSRHEFEHARRPCNYYHMKMCLGPCTLPVDPEDYKAMLQGAVDFLAGRSKETVRTIKDRMTRAAEAENYELAALCRDQLRAFEAVTEKQAVVVGDVEDADVLGFAHEDVRTAFQVLTVRRGKLVSSDAFVVRSPIQTPAEALTEFMIQYYDGRSLPEEILIPIAIDEQDDLRNALLEGHPDATKLELKVPHRGARLDLVDMANKNAQYRLGELERLTEKGRIELQILQEKLRLRRFPQRMECIDISNIQGTAIVASDVCFVGGRPAKDFYRHYVIKEISGAPDDFGSIREVVRRRIERGLQENDLPDLLVIDGGKGQLSAAVDAIKAFPSLDMDLVSLAKSRVEKGRRKTQFMDTSAPERSFERVFFPEQEVPTPLNPGTPEYRLLTQIRDEAHRFAITHHRKRRSKISHGSDLEDVPGIGPSMRRKLLERFGGVERLKNASLAELKAIKGLRESSAVALFARFRAQKEAPADASGNSDLARTAVVDHDANGEPLAAEDFTADDHADAVDAFPSGEPVPLGSS